MAGETLGAAYEALIKCMLDTLAPTLPGSPQVFWHVKPGALTTIPDFSLGQDPERPTHVILVTHSGASGNSHMKFWRNIGEVAEAKTRLQASPRVLSVVFDSTVKQGLKELAQAVVDGQLTIGDKPYGDIVIAWVRALVSSLPRDADAKVMAIRDAARVAPANVKGAWAEMEADVAVLLAQANVATDAIWRQERRRAPGRAPTARNTHVRRGVGKLLLLDDLAWVDRDGRLAATVPPGVASSLVTMGLASRGIAGTRVTDEEMLWALRHVPPARLATLHSLRAAGQAAEWIAALTTLDTIVLQLRYMAANWNVLTSTLGLLASLRACESGMLGVADVLTSQDRIWLLHVIVDYIKMHSGKQTSFGLAVITEEIKISTTNEVRLNTIDSIAPVKQWVSENTVMLALRMWHTGARRKRASIPDHHLARVCDVLARRLAPLRPPSPEADAPEIIATAIRSELEAKLLTYREFTPLQRLIESALAEADIPSAVEAAIPSCFAQHALARRPGCITALTGGTTCLRAGTVLVNWQSAHDSHTNDKRKELCARAVALRYAWDADHDAYVPRPGVTHLVLVIDGTWTQSDVDALARAGWDEVLYFDELDRLVDLVRRA